MRGRYLYYILASMHEFRSAKINRKVEDTDDCTTAANCTCEGDKQALPIRRSRSPRSKRNRPDTVCGRVGRRAGAERIRQKHVAQLDRRYGATERRAIVFSRSAF